MDYGLRLLRPQHLPADPREIYPGPWRDLLQPGALRALYFGTEFCEELLPGLREAESFCALAHEADIEAVLLTPLVTPAGLTRVTLLLEELVGRGWSPSVTFNDWGVLNLLKVSYPQLTRQAGRLINRGLRDPRLGQESLCPGADVQDKGEKLRSLLIRCGVSGVETDPDVEGCYLETAASSLQRALHLPYTFVVTGRNCLLKADSLSAEESFSKGLGRGCTAPCRGRCLPVKRNDTELPLWRSGNTLFYEAPRAQVEGHLARCDRIVLHERPLP